jgi:hypothetical protein
MTTMESTAAIMPPCTDIDNNPPVFGGPAVDMPRDDTALSAA